MESGSDEALLRSALERGWISEDEIESCREVQERVSRTGAERSLTDILQDRKLLTSGQMASLRRDGVRSGVMPVVGGYEIEERLGMGASGAVFRARRPETGELVAVKALRSQHTEDVRYLRQFEREGEVIRSLRHRNIVRGYESGWGSGFLYVVMEYVDGETLRALMQKKASRSPETICRVGARIASAIHYLAGQGVVHCDIKPGNVLISREGVVKISDWGSARLATSSLEARGNELALTTPNYMAPEFLKKRARIDHLADLYALGATLYYCVAGRPPYLGADPKAVALQVLREEPPPLRELCPDVGKDLAHIIGRLMARSRADRPQDAAKVKTALQKLARRG